MSNVGQGALAIVGGIAGFLIGGPVGAMYGAQIGLLAGSALFPTVLPGQQGPRLNDRNTTSTQVGDPVPIVWGTIAVSGTVIWLGEIVETATTETMGGKGAPQQDVTTYSYNQSIALGLCEGEISGVRRIWENGELVYDVREQLPGESADDYAQRVTASQAYAQLFDLYLGTETQDADPTMEAAEGAGNVPAFRGLAYIVYPARLLRTDQASRHPTFRFEVQRDSAWTCTPVTQYSNAVAFPWANDEEFTPLNVLNDHVFTISYLTGSPDVVRTWTEVLQATGGLAGPIGFTVPVTDAFADLADIEGGDSASIVMADALPDFRDLPAVAPGLNPGAWNQAWAYSAHNYYVSSGGRQISAAAVLFNSFFDPYDGEYWIGGDGITPCSGTAPPQAHSVGLNLWVQWNQSGGSVGSYVSAACGNVVVDSRQYDYGYFTTPAFRVAVTRVMRAPDDPCTPRGGPMPPRLGAYCYVDGNWYAAGPWEFYHDNQGTQVMRKGNLAAGVLPVGPAVHYGSANFDNQAYWEAQYAAAVAAGDMPSGLTYGANNTGDYPKWNDGSPPYGETSSGGDHWGYRRTIELCTLGPGPASLAVIVQEICERSGLEATDIDVGDLLTTTVDGYALQTVMTGRDGIEPLRSVGFFDGVESATQLRFVARGHDIVATLAETDLGAFASSESPEPPGPSITTRKTQDLELPQLLRLRYISTARDYETGEELSPARYDTDAVEVKDVQIAVAMGSDQAAQIAEILWNEAWASRWTHETAVDLSYSFLEPTDVVHVPIDGEMVRARIIQVQDSAQLVRKLSLMREDVGAYQSAAVGATSGAPVTAIRSLAGSNLYLLDIPALREADDNAGIYATAESDGTGSAWPGAAIYQSNDLGNSFSQVASLSAGAVAGTLAAGLGVGIATTWDEENEILVDIPVAAALESRTEAAVLSGANAAAIGADGRWEIVQFQYAEKLTATQWRLTRLLRGRKGSEGNIGYSLTGDRFVLLSNGGVVRLGLQTSNIGQVLQFKAVTFGALVTSGTVQSLTPRGVALRPLSPVLLGYEWTPALEAATGIYVTFARRDRLGQELPDGANLMQSEASIIYDVELIENGSPDAALATYLDVASGAQVDEYRWLLTRAEILARFGLGGADPFPATITLKIYQRSATVGDGAPLVVTLERYA